MNSFTSKFHTRSHRKHRLLKLPSLQGPIPNGYLEDCSPTDSFIPSNPSVLLPVSTIKETEQVKESEPVNVVGTSVQRVSISLTTLDDIILNADNNYTIKFNMGMVEGTGIIINEGDRIVFETEGSYYFQISGIAIPYTKVNLKLVYHEFPEDIKIFSEVPLPKDDGAISFSEATTLPIDSNQTITVRIIPEQMETITLNAGCRLLIFKVV
jgi:hypothetical protein